METTRIRTWTFFTKLFAVQKKDIGLCKKNKKMCFVYFLATISEITFALSSLKNIFVFTQKKTGEEMVNS